MCQVEARWWGHTSFCVQEDRHHVVPFERQHGLPSSDLSISFLHNVQTSMRSPLCLSVLQSCPSGTLSQQSLLCFLYLQLWHLDCELDDAPGACTSVSIIACTSVSLIMHNELAHLWAWWCFCSFLSNWHSSNLLPVGGCWVEESLLIVQCQWVFAAIQR